MAFLFIFDLEDKLERNLIHSVQCICLRICHSFFFFSSEDSDDEMMTECLPNEEHFVSSTFIYFHLLSYAFAVMSHDISPLRSSWASRCKPNSCPSFFKIQRQTWTWASHARKTFTAKTTVVRSSTNEILTWRSHLDSTWLWSVTSKSLVNFSVVVVIVNLLTLSSSLIFFSHVKRDSAHILLTIPVEKAVFGKMRVDGSLVMRVKVVLQQQQNPRFLENYKGSRDSDSHLILETFFSLWLSLANLFYLLW